MAPPHAPPPRKPLHPAHAALVAATVPLFLGATLADIAYYRTYQVHWSDFAAWLVLGGFLVAVLVAGLAFARLIRSRGKGLRSVGYAVVALFMATIGLWGAVHHARDAWAVMPGGLFLSLIATALAIAATWIAFSGSRTGDRR